MRKVKKLIRFYSIHPKKTLRKFNGLKVSPVEAFNMTQCLLDQYLRFFHEGLKELEISKDFLIVLAFTILVRIYRMNIKCNIYPNNSASDSLINSIYYENSATQRQTY